LIGVRLLRDDDGGSTERAYVYVSGRVQGVAFRDAARREASRTGVSGWARNMSDGRVEAVFEGDSPSVREMIRWCESGPPAAVVDNVETAFEEPLGEAGGFEIR
jgi:acylphosphatase